MTVTDVKVKLINGEKAVRAVTDVVFDGVLVIHGVKVVEGKSGIFISFPQRSVRDRKAKETSYFDKKDWEDYREKEISFIFQNYGLIES